MRVRIDEAGQDHGAAEIDHVGAAAVVRTAEGDNTAAIDRKPGIAQRLVGDWQDPVCAVANHRSATPETGTGHGDPESRRSFDLPSDSASPSVSCGSESVCYRASR